ncbi:MAG: nitroreductase family protein [Candidatus Aenigmatarchaeota archaeon]
MNVLEALLRRRSVRKFKDEKLTKEEVGELLRAAKWAPSAGNRQPWEIVVVRDQEIKDELAEIALEQDWMKKAGAIFVILLNEDRAESKYGERGVKLYGIQATGALIQNMLLRATEMELGACWVGSFDEDRVEDVMKTHNKDVRPVAMVAVGHPKEIPGPPPRNDINVFSHVDRYKEKNLRDWKGLVKYTKELKLETKRIMKSFEKDSE